MSDNKNKFKLMEDPKVSGGADPLTWKHCPLCGALLLNASCPYCNLEFPDAKKADDEYDTGYQSEIEVPKRRSGSANRNARKNRRGDW